MKKLDLVREAKQGWPSTEGIINNLFKAINAALVRGEVVTIYNFGEFRVVKDSRKEVYDFQNKRRVPFPGKLKICFKASPNVSKILNRDKSKDASGTGLVTGTETPGSVVV